METVELKGLSAEEAADVVVPGTILLAYRGSISHGMYVPNTDPNSIDDKDLLGVFVPGEKFYYGLESFEYHEIFKGPWDSVSYEVRKLARMLIGSNPNVLNLLWTHPKHFIIKEPEGEELLAARDLFVSRKAYHAFTGYAYGQVKKMTHLAFEGYMGEKRKKLVEKFGYDCYEDRSTEFLTDSGWRCFDSVSPEMKLGTVDIHTGNMEFQRPTGRTDKIYTGKMYTVEPYSSRAVVTAGHKLLVSPMHRSNKNKFSVQYYEESASWELLSPIQLEAGKTSHFHIRRSPEARTKEYPVDDIYLTLAGLFLSDGTLQFRDGTVKSVRLTQTKSGIFHKMAGAVSEAYPFKVHNYPKEKIWSAHGPIARKIYGDFGHAKSKHLPNWAFHLSARQADILWNALIAGDGTIKKENSVLYTSVVGLADDIQAAMLSAGHPVVRYGPYRSVTKFGTVYMWHVVRSNTSGRIHSLAFKKGRIGRNTLPDMPVKVKPVKDRRVVCFEVPNGTLITRNNGLPAIHGNCKNAAHAIRILKMGIEFLNEGRLYVDRGEVGDATQLLAIKRGEWELEKVKEEADRLFKRAEAAYDACKLPPGVDREKIDNLVIRIVKSRLARA